MHTAPALDRADIIFNAAPAFKTFLARGLRPFEISAVADAPERELPLRRIRPGRESARVEVGLTASATSPIHFALIPDRRNLQMATKKSGASKKSGAARKSAAKRKAASAKKTGPKRAGAAPKGGSKRAGAKRAGAQKVGAKRAASRAGAAMPAPAAAAEVLRRGSRGPEVEKLQEELCDLGYMTRAQMAPGRGRFGPLTEDALKHFQRDNFIPETGIDDETTQAAIRQLNEGVRRGSVGDIVRGLQNRLVSLGFMTLAQTVTGLGRLGPLTENALIAFQQSHGITPNGVLTDETYRSLLASAPVPMPPAEQGDPTSIETVLPSEGLGFTTYRREQGGADQVGRAATIRGIMAVAEAWSRLHASPRLQIGDISRRRGGPFPPHGSHRLGVDVDVRPITNNGREEPTNIGLRTYSRELTRELCQLIRSTVPGVRIFFNDRRLIDAGLTAHLAGHDDHLHVRFPS